MPLKRPQGDALLAALQERTGYAFLNLELARQALNHASAGARLENYERLEFLGDAVLSLVIADDLYKSFPQAPQGELTLRHHAVVSAETCAVIGAEIDLLPLIRADAHVKNQSGRNANKVVADVVEALIAAIYLDGGLEAARAFILRFWSSRARGGLDAIRDSKTVLQEFSAKAMKVTPRYVMESVEGPDHEPLFTVRVEIPGYPPQRGSGRSKQSAQSRAAQAFLEREGLLPREEKSP